MPYKDKEKINKYINQILILYLSKTYYIFID